MPPKRAPKKTPEELRIELELGETELRVDSMRGEIETQVDATVSEMRRIIEAAVLRLPQRIRSMTMREFMTECGGDVQVVLEKDKKMSRLARTVAKGPGALTVGRLQSSKLHSSGAAAGRLGLPLLQRPGTLPAPSSTSGSSSSLSLAHPAVTPGLSGSSRSRMPSAAAPTPGFDPRLPKTPAVRRPRRGEVLYAVSENGSPLGMVNVTRGAAARGSVAVSSGAAAAAGGAATAVTSAGDVEVILDGDLTVGDERSAALAAQERGADAVVSAIEAMQAQLERLKQAALGAEPAPGATTGTRGKSAAPPSRR